MLPTPPPNSSDRRRLIFLYISFTSPSQGQVVVQETQVSPDVTEWVISISRSTVKPGQLGSNDCTIFAVYNAVNFCC